MHGEESSPSVHGWSVLVADENVALRSYLARLLPDYGFRVHQASNGREALSAFEEHDPDVVLLDVDLPVMSALEAGEWMRVAQRGIGILFLSRRSADLPPGELGLAKPFGLEELLGAMREVLGVQ